MQMLCYANAMLCYANAMPGNAAACYVSPGAANALLACTIATEIAWFCCAVTGIRVLTLLSSHC